MSHSTLRGTLALSLLLNAGFVGTLVWQQATTDGLSLPSGAPTELTRQLGLNADQLGRWHDSNVTYLAYMRAAEEAVAQSRNGLLRSILDAATESPEVEAERARFVELQQAQQQLAIDQLLRERDILDGEQRRRFITLLAQQPAAAGFAALQRP
jgi:hypothetical protein